MAPRVQPEQLRRSEGSLLRHGHDEQPPYRCLKYSRIVGSIAGRSGREYYTFGLEFGEGQYLARTYIEGRPGALQIVTVGAPPAESLPWYLEQTGRGDLILDLRQSRDDPAWLYDPMRMHDAGWAVPNPKNVLMELSPRPFFDGVIFIQKSSPVHPTAAATKTANAGAGL